MAIKQALYLVTSLFIAAQSAAAQDAHSAFERLKALAGTWTATDDQGRPMEAKYEVVSGGTVVMESLGDMRTMYAVDGDTLLGTHYCSEGNQPRFRATDFSKSDDSLAFAFVDVTNAPDGSHISSVRFDFTGANGFVQTWGSRTQGVENAPFSFTYKRTPSYDIKVESQPERTAMVVEGTVPTAQLAASLGDYLPRVWSYVTANKGTPVSAPIARYFSFTDTEAHVQAGVFVAAALPAAGDIKPVTFAAGDVAVTTHVGTSAESGAAYESLHAWMTANGYEAAGAPWEEYIDDPATVPAYKLRTVISYPVKKLK